MSRPSRRAVLGAGVAAAAVPLAGCNPNGAQGEGDLRVSWYGGQPVHDGVEGALAAYTEQTGTALATEKAPFDDYWDKLATQVAGGQGPDLLRMSMTWFSEYADRGALVDLSERVGDSIDVSGLDEEAAESGRTDEGLFGIGQSSITQATFRNPDLAAEHDIELPETWSWDDFRTVGAEFAEAAGKGMYGTTDAGGDFQLFAVWARQHGTDLFDGASLAVDAEIIEEWLVFWDQLREDGIAPPPDVSAESDSFETSQFSQLHTAVTFGWVQQLTFFQPLLPDHALVPGDVPGASAGDLSGQFLKALDFWCLLATSTKQDEAAELLDFLITSPEAATSIGLTLGVPPSQAARDALETSPDSPEGRAIDYVERVKEQVGPSPAPWPPGYGALQGVEFPKLNQDVGFGGSTPSAAAAAFAETAAGVLGG